MWDRHHSCMFISIDAFSASRIVGEYFTLMCGEKERERERDRERGKRGIDVIDRTKPKEEEGGCQRKRERVGSRGVEENICAYMQEMTSNVSESWRRLRHV